jgi:hypothetical protein
MRTLKIALWAVLFGVVAAGVARAADDVAELKKLEQERCKAISEPNIAALGNLLADDYLHVHTSAVTMDKPTYLKSLGNSPRTTYRGDDVTVRIYGDVAVMNGTQINKNPNGSLLEMFITQAWVKKNGAWKIASFQATTKAKPKGATQ